MGALAALNGDEPTVEIIEKILSSVGIDCDKTNATKVCADLKGKNLEDVIKEGRGKLGSMPSAAAGAPAAGGAAPAAAAAEKKEEKKEEPEEESDDDMGFGLFD